jgi:hypothetical protein
MPTGLRVLLAVAAFIPAVYAFGFFFAADTMADIFDIGPAGPDLLFFLRSIGSGMIGIAIINVLCLGDAGSPALRAIVVGNLVFHLAALVVPFTAEIERNGGFWIALVIHAILVGGFGYYLANWQKLMRAKASAG